MYDEQVRQLISKPSEALTAMRDGLINQSTNPNFTIDMQHFGYVSDRFFEDKPICFGCAATCALIEICDDEPVNVASNLESSGISANSFETAIDSARRGILSPLFEFFGLWSEHDHNYDTRFHLDTAYWQKMLPAVNELITELQSKGL